LLFNDLIKFFIANSASICVFKENSMNKLIILSLIALLLPLPLQAGERTAEQPPPQVWTADEAVSFALKNSPDSRIAQQRIIAAEAMAAEAKSRFLPELTFSSEYDQTNNPMYSFGNILNQGKFNNSINFNDPGRTDNLNFKIQAQYRLYNGGSDQAAIDAAQAGQRAAAANLEAVRRQLGFEVVRLFLNTIQNQETVTAMESSLTAIRASLTVARTRYEAGTVLKADLLNLEAQEAAAAEDLIQARHALALSKRAFLMVLGLPAGNDAVELRGTAEQSPPEVLDYTRRPELAALDDAVKAAEAEVRKAQGKTRPTLDGFAGYQDDRGTVLAGSGDSWMAGVRVNYPLFDGNRAQAEIAAAQSRLAEVKEQKVKTGLALNLELQQADLELQQARQRLQVTEKMVAVAEESARLNRIRFQGGLILSSELIEVEKRLTEALVRQSAARAMQQTAIANLRRAAGLSQFEQIPATPQEKQE
jgi:outer membrane protein